MKKLKDAEKTYTTAFKLSKLGLYDQDNNNAEFKLIQVL